MTNWLTGPCEGGECWWNPETGYLESCPKHESQGMELMVEKEETSKQKVVRDGD